MTFCETRDSIFVGSKKDNEIHEFNAETWKKVETYKSHDVSHPAGLVCHGTDSLYVVSQDDNTIVEFDLKNGKSWVVVENLPDVGEQLILSRDC